MRLDLDRIATEIAPLLEVQRVELVAIEWLQGPGHGMLRIFVDRPGGDPRVPDPETSIGLEEITSVTRDVSTMMDALDLVEGTYTLEIGSPGTQRPVQSRADFDRFAGLEIRIEMRGTAREKHTLNGTLRGTADLQGGSYAVLLDVAGKTHELPRERITRSRLHELKVHLAGTPGAGTSRRQERLAARERSRAINAAHRAALPGSQTIDTHEPRASEPATAARTAGSNEPALHSDTTDHEPNPAADMPRAAKR